MGRVRRVRAGSGFVSAAELVDSSALLDSGDLVTAQSRLHRDGYLLLRDFLPAARVLQVMNGVMNGLTLVT